ncbi:MAG: phosphoglucomutase [Bdellovibrio sp. CG_4_9_14_3_um_filter_39_7]|nr:MAG: phosphoglucomutase [Bdellovibrio sp. CG_4_9_14_3_um_filter_39_7]
MSQTLNRAQAWAQNSFFEQSSRDEIKKLIDNKDLAEIEERFYRELEFGTGGLRGILGAGANRMNKYNVRKASHALATTIKKSLPEPWSVAISYDSRHFSFEFAKEAASVFAANGMKALIYQRMNPVALASFAVRHNNCSAGIMVTASHNPPKYNGYKVFWNDGAQVTPPNDKNIINEYNAITDYSQIPVVDFDLAMKEGKIQWLTEKDEDLYFAAIRKSFVNPEMCLSNGNKLKVVYTALHGTGLIPCTRALKELGLTDIEIVPEQAQPDGSFPTVKSPNPENPDALAMAVELLKKTNADIALGTDPDTDRVGIALMHENKIQYLNGNQIGILMLHYILTEYKKQGKLANNPYFVKTIVTTELQSKIAESFGVKVENTLTGFKWICGRMNEIDHNEPNRQFIFATEESFGYLNHNNVRDKDGVSSIALVAEIALHHKLQGKNLFQALDDIYQEYGFSHESLLSIDYEGKEGAEKINRIMEVFRNRKDSTIEGQEIESIDDIKKGEKRFLDGRPSQKIDLPSSNVLGLHFKNGNKLFLRPSGTEPKIKFYIMISENEGSLSDKKHKAIALTDRILSFIKTQAEKA